MRLANVDHGRALRHGGITRCDKLIRSFDVKYLTHDISIVF
jgi:hypothetical protein